MPRKRLTDTAPPRLLESDFVGISTEPLVGLLYLETDDGTIELAINGAGAEILIGDLQRFLRGERE